MRHARACVAAGADIVAIDATDRPRPDGKTLEDTVRPLKEEGVLVMADCSTIEDIRHAFAIGCDIASTTLSHPGAAIDCGMADGPDVALVAQAVAEFPACRCEGCNGCGRVGGCGWHRHHAPHEHYFLVRRGSGVAFFASHNFAHLI